MTDPRIVASGARAARWTALYLGFVVALLLSPGLVHWQPGRAFGPRSVLDLLLNGLLFVPLGISLRGWKWWVTPVLAGGIAAAAEWLQHWLPRQPDVLDVAANVIGALVGRWLAPRLPQPRLRNPRVLLVILWIAALVALCLESTRIRENDLRSWDDSFPLLIGNEAQGDRPWQGEIAALAIWDRALATEDLRQTGIAFADSPLLGIGISTDTQYFLSWELQRDGESFRLFEAQSLPAASAGEIRGGTLRVGGGRWILGDADVPDLEAEPGRHVSWSAALAQALRASGELSIKIRLRITDLDLAGPARILTFSDDPYRRNFTVGQRGRNLVLRVATPTTGPNGNAPAMETCNDPLTLGEHEVAMSFDHQRGRIFVDGRCHCDFLSGVVRTGQVLGRGLAATLYTIFALGALALGGLPLRAGRTRRVALAAVGVALSVSVLAAAGAWRHFPDYGRVVAVIAVAVMITTLPLLHATRTPTPDDGPATAP